MPQKYYKKWSHLNHDASVVYMEVIDDSVERVVEAQGDGWFWCSRLDSSDAWFELPDQPASVMELTSSDEISREEFEDVWANATRSRA